MSFQAILFDLDGTLLDTLDDIARSANRVLARHGLPIHDVDDYRRFVGDGIVTLMRRVLPDGERNDEAVRGLLEEFREEYRRNWNVKTRPYDGVPEMLDALTARRLELAVLSNKPDDFTKKCVEELLAGWTFRVVMGARPGLPRKPDPTGARRIADSLGIAAANILYVGDSGVDMQTAVAAGMFPVGVLWGFRPREELERSGARGLVKRPQEIVSWL